MRTDQKKFECSLKQRLLASSWMETVLLAGLQWNGSDIVIAAKFWTLLQPLHTQNIMVL